MLAALEALKEAGVLDRAEIRIVLSGDEKRIGSPIETNPAGHDQRGQT
jgi:hypothetical protein